MDTRDFLEKYAVKAEGPSIPRAREVASWSDVKPLRRFRPGIFPAGPFFISLFDDRGRLVEGPIRLVPSSLGVGADPSKFYFESLQVLWVHEMTTLIQYRVFNEAGDFERLNPMPKIVLKKGDRLTLDLALTP